MTSQRKTITIGETEYTVLFPDLMRPLTDRERQDLKESIEKRGIMNPVAIDEHNGIIDGENRALVAAELEFPVIPTRIVECANDEEKRQLALSLNVDRRHLSSEERQQMVKVRRQRVQKARQEGKSLRVIAEVEGVSEKQVRKDLAASVADQSAPPEEQPSASDDSPQSSSDTPASPVLEPQQPAKATRPAVST